ncbi:hypothetical protein [Sporolactobacillus nakayamae]|uniref:Hook-length control protein FliK n=1 Tax=Sporolactobacillus nakayamae TaxID=269670 RepID=A0A1I2NEM2_9BACL|nr:hypothetical protein [Sporolactobacillus nakayamae]SFG01998.1 hypothetical protein SAMN02982927_00437 [Sporolactobacillus nakayamae]
MNFQPYAINQSQLIGTYAPEQILRGKVLDILPDRTALVQLGAKQVVAKVASVDPPLKVGQDYLFQIQQGANPLLAKLVDRKPANSGSMPTMADDVLSTLQLKNDSLNKQVIQAFLDHGDPISRESILNARALLKMSGDFSGDIQTIRWMMNRQLPLTEPFFRLAKDVKTSEHLGSQFGSMLLEIQRSGAQTETVERLKTALNTFSQSQNATGLTSLVHGMGSKKNAELLRSFFDTHIPNLPEKSQHKVDSFLSSSMSLKDVAILLKDLKINRSSQAFINEVKTFAAEQIANAGSRLNETEHSNLFLKALKKLGFDYEFQISDSVKHGTLAAKPFDSLKGHLLAVVQDQGAPPTVRKMAHEMVQKITGEQIQMASADPFVAQFSLQIPIAFQKELTNVSVYWEGKRDRKGSLDPNSCTIVLWLELTHLKETLVNIRVQNRSVTLNIQNKQMDLRRWMKSGESILKKHLAEMGYDLVSLSQSEKIDRNLMKKATDPLTESNYRMDVKV